MSQKQSQKNEGPIPVGFIDIMRPSTEAWESGYGAGSTPDIEDIKWMVSNNLSYTSEFLDKYYSGGYNDEGDYPISNIDWGFSSGAGLDLPLPHPVENVPPRFFSAKTDSLIDMYDNIKADGNHDNVDPQMVTKMIEDQAEGDLYAAWARNDYGVAVEGETRPEPTAFTIGDYDPTTVPGPEGEDGSGFATVRDLPEDLTYTADIKSGIDIRPLGALSWWEGGLNNWDSMEELEKVKTYYATGEGTPSGINDYNQIANGVTLYPNPTKGILNLNSKSELSKATIYNTTGSLVKQIYLNGVSNITMDISTLNDGMFFIKLETTEGEKSVSKFIKK